ncbi:MAG: DoxX family protein [Acidobacteriota bacterium]
MMAFTTDGNELGTAPAPRATNYLLWTLQVLLALLFLFAGVMKFLTPVAKMQEGPIKLPVLFLHFIGAAEILGGLGLILPGLLRIRRGLTPLAAIGLLIIMVGATVVTLMGGGGATALIPLVIGVLLGLVVYWRREWLTA